MTKLTNWLKLQKEGIFAGAVAGLLLWADYNFLIVQRVLVWLGVPLVGGTSFFIVVPVAMAIGALIDAYYQPRR